MSKDEFTKLFKYMQEFKAEVTEGFESMGSRFDGVNNSFDAQTKLITDYHLEMMALSSKVNRLEAWIQQIAKETGVKLEYKF